MKPTAAESRYATTKVLRGVERPAQQVIFMSKSSIRTNDRRQNSWTVSLKVMAFLVMIVGLLLTPMRESEARLDPFYVLRGNHLAQFQPRIIVAFDNSASMLQKPSGGGTCTWTACEDEEGPLATRLALAKKAISQVIEQTSEQASYALMTFEMAGPPTDMVSIPEPCVKANGDAVRFTWVDWTRGRSGNLAWKPAFGPFGAFTEDGVAKGGTWLLCGDNRPFAYLRHDELGAFSMGSTESSILSDAPLYTTQSNLTGFRDSVNETRKVQFFPGFRGRRFNLDCDAPDDEAFARASMGDLSDATWSIMKPEVCGQNFYYQPYVDGYPDFSDHWLRGAEKLHEVWYDNKNIKRVTNQRKFRSGVSRGVLTGGTGSGRATLYAPFFSRVAREDVNIAARDKGPTSLGTATEDFQHFMGPVHTGGLDVRYATPWASMIGDVDDFVTVSGAIISAKPTVIRKNSAFSHPSVASYLAFLLTQGSQDLCVPTTMVMITDGLPWPQAKEGGSTLYSNLSKLRQRLGVKSYVVGFAVGFANKPEKFAELQNIACSAAGAANTNNPCAGGNEFDWDTCADPDDPSGGCVYEASDASTLADVLIEIVSGELTTSMSSGPGFATNEFLTDEDDEEYAVQTNIEAFAEMPGWKGHVVRGACSRMVDDGNGGEELDQTCVDAGKSPDTLEEEAYDFDGESGCGLSRSWDAGACLANVSWEKRRIYTYDGDNKLIRISTDGTPTAAFQELLETELGLLTDGDEAAEGTAITEFLLGKNMPSGWKLPAPANSSPIVVRRIPRRRQTSPGVNIRDPHCGGRRLTAKKEVDPDLIQFSEDAWDDSAGNGTIGLLDAGGGFDKRYEYAEAALVGDDHGILHAFHLDSGNELFGFVPRDLLSHVRDLTLNDIADGNDSEAVDFGQKPALEDHSFGLASTINQGWAWDESAEKWRHVVVFGFGPGGSEVMALDVSHMGRVDTNPIDVLWSTETTKESGQKALFDSTLGHTWSRPALTYAVPNNSMLEKPKAYVVFGSGYVDGTPTSNAHGRTVWMLDAITGETVTPFPSGASMPLPDAGTLYDIGDDYSLVGDMAISTHCLSKYWGEMQEAYFADPAGQLFRWDLGASTDADGFPHVSDSGGSWMDNGGIAVPVTRFAACQGKGDSCNVGSIGDSDVKGDVFTYSPAVVANDRIDSIDEPGDPSDIERDKFLVAMVSGSSQDGAFSVEDDPETFAIETSDFHSSIYILADDHSADADGGFVIPNGGGVTLPGVHDYFMRIPLSGIERTRHIEYPDGTEDNITQNFSKGSLPIRAPHIEVTGVMDGDVQSDLEVFYITYTIYEPGEASCDPRWYDDAEQEWIVDQGSTYELTFRLVNKGKAAFNFGNGDSLPQDPGDGFGTGGGLTMGSAEQSLDGDCADGNCGPSVGTKASKPCIPEPQIPEGPPAYSVQVAWGEVDGFSWNEVPVN